LEKEQMCPVTESNFD